MKRFIKASIPSNLDLKEELNIGKECVKYLQQLYPELKGKVTYRKKTAWSAHPYFVFIIHSDIMSKFIRAKSFDERRAKQDEYTTNINNAGNRFYNDFVECYVDCVTPDNPDSYPEVSVFCITKSRHEVN